MDEQHSAAPRRDEPSQLDLRNVFYALGLVTLVVVILVYAAEQLAPIALAILIWFLINAIANGLRTTPIIKHLLPQWLALTLASLVTIGAIVLGGKLVVDNLSELSEGLVGFDEKIAGWARTLDANFDVGAEESVRTFLRDLQVQHYLGEIVQALTSTVSYVSLVFMFVLFLLLDQPYYQAKIRALSSNPAKYDHVRKVLAQIGGDTRLYIWIMTVVSVIVGGATYGICVYFGVKGAVFWGFLTFALNFIPTIGSIVGVILPTLFALVQLDDVATIGGFVLALGVVQFVMGNLVLPHMTGDRLNLSEFVVVLSLTVWGAIWGVSGLFLAVPLMMVLAIILAQFDSTRPVAILMSKTGKVRRD